MHEKTKKKCSQHIICKQIYNFWHFLKTINSFKHRKSKKKMIKNNEKKETKRIKKMKDKKKIKRIKEHKNK